MYAYVGGNPVNVTDPTGLIAAVDDGIVIGIGIGVGACIATNCTKPITDFISIMCKSDDYSPYPQGQKCQLTGERQWPGAATKTCIYKCPGWGAPVTYEQAAGHACPEIKDNGEVDLDQIVKP